MTRSLQLTVLALAAGALAAAFVLLRPDGEDDPPPPAQVAVEQSTSKGADHEGHAGGHAPGGGGAGRLGPPAAGEEVPLIRVRRSAPVGGIVVLRARTGEPVRFAVASDVRDEVHVHGYDLLDATGPDERAELAFPARLEGVFEVELERAGAQIARLIVEPR